MILSRNSDARLSKLSPCAVAAFCMLIACGSPEESAAPAPKVSVQAPAPSPLPTPPTIPPSFTPDLASARECREQLLHFYLRTFDALLKSPLFPREMEVTRFDQLAHRLWVKEPTTSLTVSVDALARVVASRDAASLMKPPPAPGSVASQIIFPHFKDANQYHRDQYAMILTEMGLPEIAGFRTAQFSLTAVWDWDHRQLSVRDDLPWTVTLLSHYLTPGTPMKNGAGKTFTLDDILSQLVAEQRAIPADNPTVCYNAHAVYAVGAAVAAGYETFRPDAKRMLEAEIRRAREVCEPMTGVDRSSARVKLYGHLIEALYRGGERVYHLADYEQDVNFMLGAMLEEARTLRASLNYEGPFDIFTGAPHAIHGLDLLIESYPAQSPNP